MIDLDNLHKIFVRRNGKSDIMKITEAEYENTQTGIRNIEQTEQKRI